MNYKYKYTQVSEKTPIKDIGYAFLESGFTLKLYHRVTNGVCSCWMGAQCPSPGKQPLFKKKGMTATKAAFDKALLKYPNLSMGIITGYYPKLEKQLVVIDFDNKSPEVWNDVVAKLPSLLSPTFTEETWKGKHYWFWAPAGSYIFTNTCGALANKVDVLSSNDRGVLTIGSPDKFLLDNSPIATLTPEECKYLHKITDRKKASPVVKAAKVSVENKVGTKFSQEMLQNSDAMIDKFHAGKTQHGEYYHTLVLLLGAELRRNYPKYKNNVDNFVDWSISKVKNHLQDANIGQVEDYARSLHKNYDPSKVGTPTSIFNKVFKGYSSETRELLATIFQYGFKISDPEQYQGTENITVGGVSLSILKASVYKHLELLDVKEKVFFTDKQFVIFLSEFHPDMKKKRINTKAFRGRVWNLCSVSHIDLLSSLSVPEQDQGTENITVGSVSLSVPEQDQGTENITVGSVNNDLQSTVEQPKENNMTKTEQMAQRLMSIYNNKSIQPQPTTSTAVPPVEYVQEAKVEDVKVSIPEIASSTEAPVALSAYNKTLALLESLRIPPPAYTDKVEQAFAEAGFF